MIIALLITLVIASIRLPKEPSPPFLGLLVQRPTLNVPPKHRQPIPVLEAPRIEHQLQSQLKHRLGSVPPNVSDEPSKRGQDVGKLSVNRSNSGDGVIRGFATIAIIVGRHVDAQQFCARGDELVSTYVARLLSGRHFVPNP